MEVAKGHVESFLAGNACSPHATPIVEEVLFNHALKHTLVYAGRAIKKSLEGQGHSVTLQYCESPAHGHPVPFLIARDACGAFVVPTELDIREAAGAVEVVVVDGSLQTTNISRRKPLLRVHTSTSNLANKALTTNRPRRSDPTTTSKNSPAAIVILPASSGSRNL